jgi:hypothetical protein
MGLYGSILDLAQNIAGMGLNNSGLPKQLDPESTNGLRGLRQLSVAWL